jgi:hypothetical protein
MDIQREMFEALDHIKRLLDYSKFNEKMNSYELVRDENYAIRDTCELNTASKAQAVPEGFMALAVDDVERFLRCLDDHAIYITHKASDALENIRKAMIEAQE